MVPLQNWPEWYKKKYIVAVYELSLLHPRLYSYLNPDLRTVAKFSGFGFGLDLNFLSLWIWTLF